MHPIQPTAPLNEKHRGEFTRSLKPMKGVGSVPRAGRPPQGSGEMNIRKLKGTSADRILRRAHGSMKGGF